MLTTQCKRILLAKQLLGLITKKSLVILYQIIVISANFIYTAIALDFLSICQIKILSYYIKIHSVAILFYYYPSFTLYYLIKWLGEACKDVFNFVKASSMVSAFNAFTESLAHH